MLEAKEGLALINGTHLMAALGALVLAIQSVYSRPHCVLPRCRPTPAGALTPTSTRACTTRAANADSTAVAARLRALIQGRTYRATCTTIHACKTPTPCAAPRRCSVPRRWDRVCPFLVEREFGAVTDNPLVFAADERGAVACRSSTCQPLSLPLDHLALALAELASFAERRVNALPDPELRRAARVPDACTPGCPRA